MQRRQRVVVERLDRRARLQSQPAAQRFLVDEAAQKGMHGLARAQALWLALTQDDATAHARLDHANAQTSYWMQISSLGGQ